jgi:putative ABC transport system ATP-binding protein
LCNLLLTPSEGQVFVQGKEVREWQIPELRRTVGMVFQTPTMFAGSVRDNLVLGSQLRGETLDNPEQFLEQVGLPASLLTRDAQELSGGQKQRVALARTLVNDSEILLLDEITSGLDPGAAREIEELIQHIHSQHRKTILWVTHDMDQARRVGEFTWLIVEGEVIEANSTQALFDNPANEITRRFLQGEL